MKVEVIDDADKSMEQPADGYYRDRLLKGGQKWMRVHVVVSTGMDLSCDFI